ncbi:MAG TPA: hypothetical protein GX721_02700 [Firmicutes bacterium]|nr:hypothetical protein [Bacillota bacterium]
MDLITCLGNAQSRRGHTRLGMNSARLLGLFLVLCIALADVPMLRCAAFAENSADEVVLEFNTLSDKTHTYQVLISETVYSDGQRLTNLYREDFKIQETAATSGKAVRTVVCVGSVTPVGGEIRKLEPSGYYLTVDKTGRIVEVRGLKPWDGRRLETIWLAQVLLPEYPVRPGDTWTANDAFFSMTTAGKTHEKRAYRFLGTENLGAVTAHKIGYEIVGKGQDDLQEYTYVSTGAFYLASGDLVKLDASEMVTYGGGSGDSKIITMIQVSAVN